MGGWVKQNGGTDERAVRGRLELSHGNRGGVNSPGEHGTKNGPHLTYGPAMDWGIMGYSKFYVGK